MRLDVLDQSWLSRFDTIPASPPRDDQQRRWSTPPITHQVTVQPTAQGPQRSREQAGSMDEIGRNDHLMHRQSQNERQGRRSLLEPPSTAPRITVEQAEAHLAQASARYRRAEREYYASRFKSMDVALELSDAGRVLERAKEELAEARTFAATDLPTNE